MSWSDATDPSDSWSGVTDPSSDSGVATTAMRHTLGAEAGTTHRIRLGDYVRIGGLGFNVVTDPGDADNWSDSSGDPSNTWSDVA